MQQEQQTSQQTSWADWQEEDRFDPEDFETDRDESESEGGAPETEDAIRLNPSGRAWLEAGGFTLMERNKYRGRWLNHRHRLYRHFGRHDRPLNISRKWTPV